jgi:hypothetical protein
LHCPSGRAAQFNFINTEIGRKRAPVILLQLPWHTTPQELLEIGSVPTEQAGDRQTVVASLLHQRLQMIPDVIHFLFSYDRNFPCAIGNILSDRIIPIKSDSDLKEGGLNECTGQD